MDLKTYLFKNGIKQSELARACGISPTIICDLVHKRQHFSWELCDIVSKATGGAVKAEDMVARKHTKCPTCGRLWRKK